MRKVLCLSCGEYRPYTLWYKDKSVVYEGKKINYSEKYAICDRCGEEVNVPGLWDENLNKLEEIWRALN